MDFKDLVFNFALLLLKVSNLISQVSQMKKTKPSPQLENLGLHLFSFWVTVKVDFYEDLFVKGLWDIVLCVYVWTICLLFLNLSKEPSYY